MSKKEPLAQCGEGINTLAAVWHPCLISQGLRIQTLFSRGAGVGSSAKISVVQTCTLQPLSCPSSARPVATGPGPGHQNPRCTEQQHLDLWTGSGYFNCGLIMKGGELGQTSQRRAAAGDGVRMQCKADVGVCAPGKWEGDGREGPLVDSRCSPPAAGQISGGQGRVEGFMAHKRLHG